MPIVEWCLTPGAPISLQWDYYTCDRFEKLIPFEKVLVSKHPSCRITPPKYVHTNVEHFVGIMHIDFRIKIPLERWLLMNVRIIFKNDIRERLSTIWTLAHIR